MLLTACSTIEKTQKYVPLKNCEIEPGLTEELEYPKKRISEETLYAIVQDPLHNVSAVLKCEID